MITKGTITLYGQNLNIEYQVHNAFDPIEIISVNGIMYSEVFFKRDVLNDIEFETGRIEADKAHEKKVA